MKHAMTAAVEVRLTRPPGPGAHVPWGEKVGFIWERHGDVKLRADTVEHLCHLAENHAREVYAGWKSDDLEAVKVEGYVVVGPSTIRVTSFLDWRTTRD